MVKFTCQLTIFIQADSRACTAQVCCVKILLRAGAAMTQEQLTIVLHALPALESPRVPLLYSNAVPFSISTHHEKLLLRSLAIDTCAAHD